MKAMAPAGACAKRKWGDRPMNNLVWLLLGFAGGDSFDRAAAEPTPEQQYEALVGARDKVHRAFLKANEEAKTDEQFRAIPNFNDRNYAGGFMALARQYPGTPTAENALLWVCSHTFSFPDCEEAKRRVIRDHVRSARLGPALGFQGHYSDYFEGT
jgi:hypothetical protein